MPQQDDNNSVEKQSLPDVQNTNKEREKKKEAEDNI